MMEQHRFTGDQLWCVLRTATPRTLAVARSLTDAGIDAWTPSEVKDKRIERSRKRIEVMQAMMPSFVFAQAQHLATLVEISHKPLSVHPAFSVARFHDAYPLVRDVELNPLRRLEASRKKQRALKERPTALAKGTRIRMTEGGFAGMDGIVESSNGQFTLVAFPGWSMPIKISTWLLASDVALVSA